MIIARPDRWQSARTGVAVFNINRKIDFGNWTVWKCHKWNRMLTPVTMYIRAVGVALFRKPNHQLLWTNRMKMPKIARSDPWQSTRRLSINRNTDFYPFYGWTVWKFHKWNRILRPVTMWMRARRSRAFQETEPPINLQPHPTLTCPRDFSSSAIFVSMFPTLRSPSGLRPFWFDFPRCSPGLCGKLVIQRMNTITVKYQGKWYNDWLQKNDHNVYV